MRGCSGSTTGCGTAASSATSRSSRARVVDVAGAVRGREHVLAGRHAEALEHLGARGRARAEQLRDVDHHVADHLDLAAHALAAQVLRRAPSTSTAAGRSRGR